MRRHKKNLPTYLVFILFLCAPLLLAQAPRLFYTDLISGPASGGEAGQGSFVTLYGTGFGRERGASTVTLGDHPVFSYPAWSDSKVVIQIGHAARSGSIVLHRSPAVESNALPFTVRSGRILFVSTNGDDSHNGSFAKPKQTIVATKDELEPGDIAYVMNGVTQASLDKYDSALSIQTSGRPGAPIAIVAYPGATVTIGSFKGPQIAARTPNIDRTSDHWVLAGLTFHGAQEALDVTDSKDWRIVGNDFSCPNGFGPSGCIEASQALSVALLGNHIHDVARPRTTKVYHAVYFSTDSNHIEVAWNTIEGVNGCRGLQFHSTPTDRGTGHNQFDLHIHDNVIHDVVCDAINLATIDPSRGTVEVYNNLIYRVGLGPDPEDGSANYACIYVQGGANAGPAGTGTVSIYNNTMYDCGARKNSDSGAIALAPGSPHQRISLTNNIIALRAGIPLLSPSSNPSLLDAQHNVFWTIPAQPHPAQALPAASLRPGFLAADPLFTDPSQANFSLRERSPAIAAGIGPGSPFDLRGMSRPIDHPDLGALQHAPLQHAALQPAAQPQP